MSISFLINSLSGGGAERQLAILLNYFPHKNVYTLEKNSTNAKHVPLSWHTKKTPTFIKALSLRYYSKKLASMCARDETIVSFMTRANAVNVISSEKTGHIPIISERTNPSMEFSGLRMKIYNKILRKTYQNSNLIITNSMGTAKELIKSFSLKEDKIVTISNHIDIKMASEMAKEEIKGYEKIFSKPVIINTGRLTEAKGQWHLIKIFSTIRKREKNLRLVILGEGPLKNFLKKMCEAEGLDFFDASQEDSFMDQDVCFMGAVENPFKFLSRSKIFVLTSLWESFPNAILEAMACAVACISANCKYGPLEIMSINPDLSLYEFKEEIKEDFGILLPPLPRLKESNTNEYDKTISIWSEAILSTLKDEKQLSLYSSLSKARASDFDVKKIIPLWRKTLEKYERN